MLKAWSLLPWIPFLRPSCREWYRLGAIKGKEICFECLPTGPTNRNQNETKKPVATRKFMFNYMSSKDVHRSRRMLQSGCLWRGPSCRLCTYPSMHTGVRRELLEKTEEKPSENRKESREKLTCQAGSTLLNSRRLNEGGNMPLSRYRLVIKAALLISNTLKH